MEMKVTDQTEVTIKLGVDFFSCALRLVGFALVRILTRWKIGGFVGANLFARGGSWSQEQFSSTKRDELIFEQFCNNFIEIIKNIDCIMGLHVKVGLCVLTFIKLWLRAEIQSFYFMHSAYLNASHWIYLNRYDIGNFTVLHPETFFKGIKQRRTEIKSILINQISFQLRVFNSLTKKRAFHHSLWYWCSSYVWPL